METARWMDGPEEAETPAQGEDQARVDSTPTTLRGLLWLGVMAVLFGIARAGVARAFIPHWWAKW